MGFICSGPVRYDLVKGFWTYKRDGHMLHEKLANELQRLVGFEIDLNPCSYCGKRQGCMNNYECTS